MMFNLGSTRIRGTPRSGILSRTRSPPGRAEVHASIGAHARLGQFFLDAQELIVLDKPLRSTRCSCLDLASTEPNGEVSYEGILGLSRAMRHHHTPTRGDGQLRGLNRFCDGADLVHLEQQRVAELLLTCHAHALGIGDQQVVAHDLRLRPNHCLELGIGFKVVLIEGVFDGDERVFLEPPLVVSNEFICLFFHTWSTPFRVLEVQIVGVGLFAVEL
mmetsp:Transcript_16922/g.45876  ORF Transcript_16922/g.45876 Transcript_16922/m.45876 type:complete len:217 (+) Transcript_16922:278-928(+)